jgi:hypothetical protein
MPTRGGAVPSRAVAAPTTERTLPPPAEHAPQVQAVVGKRAAPEAAAGALEGSSRLRSPRVDHACQEQLAQGEARGGVREGDQLWARSVACTFLMSSASGGADAHCDETGIENTQLDYECAAAEESQCIASSGCIVESLARCRASCLAGTGLSLIAGLMWPEMTSDERHAPG